MTGPKLDTRWRHAPELKRQVLAECAAPGTSVAKVAMSHGLNANLVHKWRRLLAHDRDGAIAGAFVPVSIVSPPVETPQFIEVDLQRGPVNVRVRWPTTSASSCAAWLREMLR